MNTVPVPKVFVSHASEDKERFVRGFAERLRQSGIDAWYDGWEIMPGDDLVNKIFEEGLKNAQCVIIVLSKVSIQKPWVREELNVSVVRRIQGESRIIPVIIDDDFEVPEALRAILWVKIPDVTNYEDALGRIVNSIYGFSDRPPLGAPPRHVQLAIDKMPGLSDIDTLVFSIACEVVLEGSSDFVDTDQLIQRLKKLEVSDDAIEESLHILHNRRLLEVTRFSGNSIGIVKLTLHGFENYGKFYISDFNNLVNRVLLTIVNDDLKLNGDISDRNGITPLVGEFILEMLTQRKYINIVKVFGDIRQSVYVHNVTPVGRRQASQVR